MTVTISFVEMTAPGQLTPSPPVPGLTLDPAGGDDPALVTELHARVGAPHGWTATSRTPADWADWYEDHPALTSWLLLHEDVPAGLVRYEPVGPDVEIVAFGLLPEYVGRGLGGYALTLAVRRAWLLTTPVRRVWLHTSSRDHTRALPNYHARGFRTYRTEHRPDY